MKTVKALVIMAIVGLIGTTTFASTPTQPQTVTTQTHVAKTNKKAAKKHVKHHRKHKKIHVAKTAE